MNISGATAKTYTLTSADVDHRLRVLVTASNADGQATATSNTTALVSSSSAPVNTAKPTISGTPVVGEELTANPGTWTGGVTSFMYQWMRCDTTGGACVNVTDATTKTYAIRSADVGHTLRVRVTAQNTSGSTASATSDPTTPVRPLPVSTTTTVVTTTVPGHRPPRIFFLSLRRVGITVFARFKVCADRPSRITIIERDNKARALSFTRTFRITIATCGSFSRHWIPAARFRTHGRYVVTLRARDQLGALSLLVSRSLFF